MRTSLLLLLLTLTACYRRAPGTCGTGEGHISSRDTSFTDARDRCGADRGLVPLLDTPTATTAELLFELEHKDKDLETTMIALRLSADVAVSAFSDGASTPLTTGELCTSFDWDGFCEDYAELTEGQLDVLKVGPVSKYNESFYKVAWSATWGDPAGQETWVQVEGEDWVSVVQ